MTNITIRLDSTEEIIAFNKIITRYNCDFDLEVGHNYVDAKSLLGIYSLSLKKPMTLHIQADSDLANEIIGELDSYICEERVK
ncbi:MAG: HPr family phosphocarrier protein [Lachnospiraceae bacterium]|nr:HPr family phosphocarrier protein [Lachnospiraceae bacterium]